MSYAVRGRVVLKYFGKLCIILGAMTLVTVIVSLILEEYFLTLTYLQVFLFLSLLGFTLGRRKAPDNVQTNEALAITALIFLFTALVASYPMVAAGLQFEDALFESISGITTTGLSTLPTMEGKAGTFLFARAWTQWIGGLGIVVFSIAILMRPGIATKRFIEMDKKEDIVGGTRVYAVQVTKVYLILTGAGIGLLLLMGESLFSSVTHTLAAVSTGGFSIYDNSLSGFKKMGARVAIILISFLGAVSLILYYQVTQKGGLKKMMADIEVRVLMFACCITTLLLTFFMILANSESWHRVLSQAPLLAFSSQTTTGFSNINIHQMDSASKLVLVVSMMLGGSVGSTADGIKIIRVVILIKLIRMILIRTSLSGHAVVDMRLSGQKLDTDDVERALIVMLFFIIIVALSWFSFVIMGYDPVDSLFEVASATGTVGLSTGITSGDLHTFLKGVLCADMFMGRLEIIALLVLVFPKTWFGRRLQSL
ncbi:MAG: TrkH family potassium uptake protein [Nitrospirota bacterium]